MGPMKAAVITGRIARRGRARVIRAELLASDDDEASHEIAHARSSPMRIEAIRASVRPGGGSARIVVRPVATGLTR